MADIGKLSPAYRIPATRPGAGAGHSNQAPRRKPEADNRRDEQPDRRRKDDDNAHIDEYA